MNFQQLKYFMALCNAGSLSKAAKSLYISQQGLSMSIASLESELSRKLFVRTPRGLVLTEDGKYFRQWANQMVRDFDDLHEHFENQSLGTGIIKCAAVQGAICEFAGSIIEGFEAIYKDYSVHIREYKDRRCDRIMENDEAEVGFGMEPLDHSKFECYKIFERRLVCLMCSGHPWEKYDKIPLSVLQDEEFFLVDEEFKSSDSFIDICARYGVNIMPRMRVGEVVAVHRLVRSQCGVGLTTSTVAESLATSDTVWRPFDCDETTWSVSLYKKRDAVLSRPAQAFFDYVLKLRCKMPNT